MKIVAIIFSLFTQIVCSYSQQPWPGSNWEATTDLTAVMSPQGVVELSGVHYNPSQNRLFLVQDIGRLRVIQLDEENGNHVQLADFNIGGDAEGITQINDDDHEAWVINENDLRIERYQFSPNFSIITLLRTYDLSLPQSGFTVFNDGGPEGICFIPDSFLQSAGFMSSVTGQSYSSQKGMGGLMFIAHQHQGQIWVFDINPEVNDDYVLVGTYNTNRQESCGLSFDPSTGLLYVLHNLDNNYLEVCNLSVSQTGQNYKLNMVEEFHVTVPVNGNRNIEGVAVSRKCDDPMNPTLWLVRDLSGQHSVNSLKQFRPFGLLGSCEASLENQVSQSGFVLFPNPSTGIVYLELGQEENLVEVLDLNGKLVLESTLDGPIGELNLSQLERGLYLVRIGGQVARLILE